jgi:hypothetical protein
MASNESGTPNGNRDKRDPREPLMGERLNQKMTAAAQAARGRVSALMGNPRAEKLWQLVCMSPASGRVHQQFVSYCAASGQLAYAARRYREWLDSGSYPELAPKFFQQIVTLVGVKLTSRHARQSFLRWSGALKLEALLYFASGVGMAAGVLVPQRTFFLWAGLIVASVLTILRVLRLPLTSRLDTGHTPPPGEGADA